MSMQKITQEIEQEIEQETSQENFFQYAPDVISIYEETRQSIVEEITKKPYQKAFNNITTMLEECYFIGATKFGSNFIA